jgi:hypothetical protein
MRSTNWRRRSRGDGVEADLDREEADSVHTTPTEEDERKKTTASRSPSTPDGEAPWWSRSDGVEWRGTRRGRRAASLDTTPQQRRQSLTGVGGGASEEKEKRATPGRGAYKGGGFYPRRERAQSFHGSRTSQPPPPRNRPKSPTRSSARPSPRKMRGVSLPGSQAEGGEKQLSGQAGRWAKGTKHEQLQLVSSGHPFGPLPNVPQITS